MPIYFYSFSLNLSLRILDDKNKLQLPSQRAHTKMIPPEPPGLKYATFYATQTMVKNKEIKKKKI